LRAFQTARRIFRKAKGTGRKAQVKILFPSCRNMKQGFPPSRTKKAKGTGLKAQGKTLRFFKLDKSVVLAPCTMRHAPYFYVAGGNLRRTQLIGKRAISDLKLVEDVPHRINRHLVEMDLIVQVGAG